MAESPTDIASVLKNSQNVLDAAVATVSATRTTQNTLEKNIELTDKKIGIHNVDEEAHEDIRAQLSRMIDEPIVTGPSSAEHEVASTWTFTATPLVNFVTVEKFVVTLSDGTSEDVPTSTGTATWTHTFTDTTGSGSSTTFSVYAYGSSFRSATVVKELAITHHYPPSMDEVVCTLPEICNGGDVIEWSIDGITDVDDDLKSISASVDNSYVTLSQKSDLKQGTTYKLTVADTAGVSGGTFHVVFTALDDFGMTNSISYTVKINARPNVNNITYVIPTRINPSSTNTLTVSGATKPETGSSDEITYDLSCDNSALTFSKTTNIKQNETVNVVASSSAVAGSTYNITLTFKDSYGGVSTKVISGTINRVPDVSGINLGLPAKFVPGKTYSFVATGAVDPDADTVTYSITSNEGNFTFSKTSNIAAGSTVTFTVPSTATRGATYSWSLTATDKYGASASAKQSCTINTIRSASEFTFKARFTVATNTYNPVTINSTGVAFVPSTSSATNAVELWYEPINSTNGTAYTAKWTLTNSNYKASADTISAGISGTWATSTKYTAPSEKQLARGEAFTATVTLNDGYEDITVPVGKFYQARLPVTTNATITPSRLFTSGKANTFKVTGVTNPDTAAGITGKFSGYSSWGSLAVTNVTSDSVGFNTASYTANDISSKNYEVTVASDVEPGSDLYLAVIVQSITGATTTLTKNFVANRLPVVSACTITAKHVDYNDDTVTETIAVGKTLVAVPKTAYTLTLNGATDPEGETLTYRYGSASALTSNTAGSACTGSSYSITNSQWVSRGQSSTYGFSAVDYSYAFNVAKFTVLINNTLDVSKCNPVSQLPAKLVPGKSYSLKITGATSSTSDKTITYTITNIPSGFTFSKTTGIFNGDTVTLTLASSVAYKSDFTWTLNAFDGYEAPTAITQSVTTASALSADDIKLYVAGILRNNNDFVVAPGGTFTFTATPLTTSSNDAITVTWSTNNSNATFISSTNGTGVYHAPTAAQLARGSYVTCTATFTDGYTTVSKSFKIYQNSLPVVSSAKMVYSGQITAGYSKSFTLSGITDADVTAGRITSSGSAAALTVPSISSSGQTVTFTGASSTATPTSTFTITPSSTATAGGSVTVAARISDGLESATTNIGITLNKNPDLSAGEFSFSFTNSDGSVRTQSYGVTTAITNLRIVPGSTITFKPSKVTDPEGETITYSIDFPDLTVTNGTNISEGGSATLTVPSSLTRGSTHTGTITATDASGGKSTVSITAVVNQKPNLSSLKNSLASKLLPGKTYSFTFTGGTDADDTIKYALSNIPNGLTFSKTSGITEGETISVTLASTITRGQTYTWTVSASDIEGTVSTTQSLYIRKILDVADIKTYINGHEFTDNCVMESVDDTYLTVTPLTDPEGETLAVTWSMVDGTQEVDDDLVDYFISSTSTNGKAYISLSNCSSYTVFTVTATFNNGYETVSKDFYVWVDHGPDLTNMVCTMTGTLIPGKAKSFQFSGITNKYANYVCKNGLVGTGTVTWSGASSSTFSSTSIDKTESGITYATATLLASLARGSTAYWYMVVTDNAGACSSKQFSAAVGRVPVMTNANITAVITDHSAVVSSTQTVSGTSGGSWIVPPGATLKITAQGASDPDNLGFSAASISVDSSFKSSYVSSLTSVNDGSTVTATLVLNTSVSRGTTFNIYYNVTDIDGDSVTRTISCIVPAVTATDDVFSFLGSKMSNSSLTNYYCRHYFTDLTSLAGPLKTFFSGDTLFTDPNGYSISDVTLSETTKVASGDVGTSDVEFVFFAFNTEGREQYTASANRNSESSTTLKPLAYDGFNCGFYGTEVYVDTAANATITATWKTPYEQVSDSVLVFMVPWYHAADMLGGWDTTLGITGGYGGKSGTITVGTPTIGEVYSVITNGDAKYADTGAAWSTVANGPNVKITSTYNRNITGDNTTYPVVYRTDTTTYEVVGTSVTINIVSTATVSGTAWLNAGYVYTATTMVPELQVKLKDSTGETAVRCSVNQYTPYDSNSALATWAATDWNKFKVQVSPVYKTPAPSLTYPTASCTVSGLDTAGSTWTAKWTACDTMGVQMDGNGAACSTLLLNSDGTPKKWLDGNSWSGYHAGS